MRKLRNRCEIKPIILREPCPYEIICSYSENCRDDDWEHCGIFIQIKKLFDNNGKMS